MLGRAPASLHWGKDCSVRLLFFFELLSPVLKRLLKTASCCVIPCAACGKISTTIKCKTCKISNISYTGRWYCVSCLYIYVCVWCVIIYIYNYIYIALLSASFIDYIDTFICCLLMSFVFTWPQVERRDAFVLPACASWWRTPSIRRCSFLTLSSCEG
jgi:hypothetical protein